MMANRQKKDQKVEITPQRTVLEQRVTNKCSPKQKKTNTAILKHLFKKNPASAACKTFLPPL